MNFNFDMIAFKILLTTAFISGFITYISKPPYSNATHKLIHKISGNLFGISLILFICYGIIGLIWLL